MNSDSYTCLDGFILNSGNLLYFKCYTWSLESRVKELLQEAWGGSPPCSWGRQQESQEVDGFQIFLGRRLLSPMAEWTEKSRMLQKYKIKTDFKENCPRCYILSSRMWQKMPWGGEDDSNLYLRYPSMSKCYPKGAITERNYYAKP